MLRGRPRQVRRWRGLRVKLVTIIILALLPISGLLAYLWIGARERDRDDSLQSLTQMASAVAVIADQLFDEGLMLGHTMATDPAVQSLDPARFVPRLRQVRALHPQYASLVVSDANGTILGWAADDPLPDPPPTFMSRSFLARVKGSGQPTTIYAADGEGPAALSTGVAVPIVAEDGSLIGLVALAFDVDHVSRDLARLHLLPGQVVSLIDPRGRVAGLASQASLSVTDVPWARRDVSGLPGMQAALQGTQVATDAFESPSFEDRRLAVFTPTPRHQWIISVTWPLGEALGPTQQAAQRELVVFSVILCVILSGALVVSRALIEPLRRLADHARRLGAGDFAPITTPFSGDELGDLARTFNTVGTQLDQTISALRRERALLETVVQQLPVGVVIRSAPDGGVLLVNAEAERIWRRPASEIASPDWFSRPTRLDAEGRPLAAESRPFTRSLTHGETVHGMEMTIVRGDGTMGTVVVSSAPLHEGDQEIRGVVSVIDDVTERRQTEQQLRDREELLRALMDQFPAAVAVFDRELRYVLAAGQWFVDDGQVRRDLVGTRLADAYIASDVRAIEPYAQRAFAGETVSCDASLADKSVRITMTPLRDAAGTIVHILTVAFDVTEERARLERASQDEKLHALGQMAGGIAHDLNQTLALVTGYGELARAALEQQPIDIAGLSRMMQTIERAAYDGGETVKRLLTFARGRDDGQRQVVDVADLLHDVVELTAPRWRESARAEGSQVEIEVNASPGLSIAGAPNGLREALTNLVFNALDAMPRGGKITLSARQAADYGTIEVADTGHGMAPEVRRRIFEPFFTTKGERGTGLGLAMVFGIVRQHGGEIEVFSEPGQGTTMRLSLPLATPQSITPPLWDADSVVRPLRVLVVDDEARLAELAAGMLRRDGHHVTQALSGLEALDLLRATSFDMVLSDLSMGEGMNGWELAAEAARIAPGLPFVLATGWGAAIEEADARARGVAAVLAKPFRISDLREVVARVVRG